MSNNGTCGIMTDEQIGKLYDAVMYLVRCHEEQQCQKQSYISGLQSMPASVQTTPAKKAETWPGNSLFEVSTPPEKDMKLSPSSPKTNEA